MHLAMCGGCRKFSKRMDCLRAACKRYADTFAFDVTVSSPYDAPQCYADGFRLMGKGGEIFGERKLWHGHATEQPFTPDLYGVRIPHIVRSVMVQARDQKVGYGGRTMELMLPAG